jgi:hypothetical protein
VDKIQYLTQRVIDYALFGDKQLLIITGKHEKKTSKNGIMGFIKSTSLFEMISKGTGKTEAKEDERL